MELSNYKSSRYSSVWQKHFTLQEAGRPGPVLIDITKDAQFEDLIFV